MLKRGPCVVWCLWLWCCPLLLFYWFSLGQTKTQPLVTFYEHTWPEQWSRNENAQKCAVVCNSSRLINVPFSFPLFCCFDNSLVLVRAGGHQELGPMFRAFYIFLLQLRPGVVGQASHSDFVIHLIISARRYNLIRKRMSAHLFVQVISCTIPNIMLPPSNPT